MTTFARPSNSRSQTPPASTDTASTSTHPAVTVFGIAFAGYVAICAVFTGIGLLITHQTGGLVRVDDHVVRWFADHRTHTLTTWSGHATSVADTLGILVVFVVATIVLLLLRFRWEALFLAVALAIELTTFLTVNRFVDRPRPHGPRLGSLPSTSSFPSGHTAAMVVLYCGLALIVSAHVRSAFVAVLAWMIAVVATASVGVGRIYAGMHHPSDVVAGALVGAAALVVATYAVRAGKHAAHERHPVEVAPLDEPVRDAHVVT